MGSVIDDYPASAQCSVRVSKLAGGETAKIYVTGTAATVWAFWDTGGGGVCTFSRVIGLPSLRLCAGAMLFSAPQRSADFYSALNGGAPAQPGADPVIPPSVASLYLWGQKLNGGGKRQVTLKSPGSETAIVEFAFGDGGASALWIPVTANGTVIDWP